MTPLVRTLGLRDLFLLFIGSVIGSGIFLTPGLILRQLDGSVGFSLFVWLTGGVLSLLGALTYAELAAANPEAGGLYCYIRDGFGRIPAFLYGWCLFLVIASGSVAALARAFTRYLAEVLPLSAAGSTTVSVLMIGVVTAVNVWGTRKSSDLQNWTTLIKAGLIVLLSAVLLSLGHHAGDLPAALGTTEKGFSLFSHFGLAMIAALWAYEGWQFGTYSAGEVLEPQKFFPRAFLLGSLVLVGLYLVAVFAYLVALGPVAATASDAIAATAVGVVLGPWAGKIIAVTILISTFSSANSVILTAPPSSTPWPTTICSSRTSPKFTRDFAPLRPPLLLLACGPPCSLAPENLRSSLAASFLSAGFSTASARPRFFRCGAPHKAGLFPTASPATPGPRSYSCSPPVRWSPTPSFSPSRTPSNSAI